ncbi:tyrosine-protein phosphatase [Sphingomonas colocasiae]|uniref:Tyrosine-protein phosphatase n=1 Tax=Sphingomonas colocasiae TaxID=1848973 RepID=A0ABS7PSK4_9SPHN|nr:tyrosine-protein phosphatase [Sphingomonas colocasiae]MBY8824322.1 tyrosine-protein phosphatase [Sphingomonas colocasiae]
MTGRAGGNALRLACAPNFRDLGGLPTMDGGQVRPGRLFRSDFVHRPDGDDLAALEGCGIGLVLDLRSASEVTSHPNHYWHARDVEVLTFDIGTDVRAKGSFWDVLREDASPPRVEALIHSIYRSIPIAVAPALTTLFDRLSRPDALGVLLHCTAGKDRTGVAVALLLHALGVTREAIVADYLETCERLTDRVLARARKTMTEVAGKPLEEASLRYLTHVEAAFLDQSWSRLDRKYGGADAFLETEAGLDEARRAALRAALVQGYN